MTKKDYILIAQAIRGMYPRDGLITAEAWAIRLDVAERLAAYLSTDNPRFDRDKFIEACTGRPAPDRVRP
jgi:hypothetical protein